MADDGSAFFDTADVAAQTLTASAQEKLRQIVARIEKLEEEKKNIASDIKDAYGEAKSLGYDTKALRKVVTLRRQDRAERAEQEAMMELYLAALGEI